MSRIFHRTNRQFSTAVTKSINDFVHAANSDGPRIFVSGFNQPFLNIAMEDYIFQKMPISENEAINNRLLLYVNNPCVVLGRNQNPWRECNVPLIKSLQIPLIRRRSGGGTVVHDTQNINFSVMTRREDFTRDRHAQMIVDAVNELPTKVQKLVVPVEKNTGSEVIEVNGPQIKLRVNERYDIVELEQGRKVSGSAFKIQRQKAYHHGTMLLNSKLDILKALISRSDSMGSIEGRGVESVKSPVANIGMDKDICITTVIQAFLKEYEVKDSLVLLINSAHLPEEIHKAAKVMEEWEWTFGQTPDFQHSITIPGEFGFMNEVKLKFQVSKGLLKSIELVDQTMTLQDVDPGLAFLQLLLQEQGQKMQYTSANIGEYVNNSVLRKGIQGALDGPGSL